MVFRFPKITSRASKRNSREKEVFSCDRSFLRLDHAGKPLFFFNFFVLERSFFFEHRKTTNEALHLPQKCLNVKKKASLRSGNVRFLFSSPGKKTKKVSKSPRSSSSWSLFSHFWVSAGFSLSWFVGNISLYLATETFPTGNHQCKSWSQLKKKQAHKVRC